MATRKEARKRSLLQILGMVIAVAVIAVAAVLIQSWWNNRPAPDPSTISITASVGDRSEEIAPYMVCELGVECPEGDVPTISVDENDTLHLEIPDEIRDTQWKLLRIYDDPAANDESLYGAGEKNSVDIPGSVDPIEASDSDKRPQLQVVEVSNVMVSEVDGKEEAPYSVVWSIATQATED